MNDKDRDLIQSVLQAAGKAGEQGFAYLVHYKFIDGLTTMAFCAIALGGFFWLASRAFAWKPKEDWMGDGTFARGGAIVICCLGCFLCLLGFFSGITVVLAPEGAAIRSVLVR